MLTKLGILPSTVRIRWLVITTQYRNISDGCGKRWRRQTGYRTRVSGRKLGWYCRRCGSFMSGQVSYHPLIWVLASLSLCLGVLSLEVISILFRTDSRCTNIFSTHLELLCLLRFIGVFWPMHCPDDKCHALLGLPRIGRWLRRLDPRWCIWHSLNFDTVL